MTQPVGSTVQKPEPVGGRGLPPPSPAYLEAKASLHDGPGKYLGMVAPIRPRFGSAGLRSTEFWLCAATALLGAILCFAWPLPSALAGAALVGLGSSSYAYSRGKAKGRPYLSPGKL